MNEPTIEVTTDRTAELMAMIAKFKNDSVLVGIPEEDNGREGEDSSDIGNAALLFINNFGSPVNNIPPRPVMNIGIFNAQDAIALEFAGAVKNGLKEGLSSLPKYYERVGIIASNSVKRAITSQEGIEAPAESTIKARKRKGFSGAKALLVTGQLRNAITYVVKEG